MPALTRRALTKAALLSIAVPTARAATGVSTPVAHTTSGPVRGYVEKNINVFKGIPYGQNTGGQNRFKPAQAPAAWTDVLDTVEYGSPAPQPRSALFPQTVTDEDCLVLNVWTPGFDAAERPVMVWLHGGGFSSLSGSSPMYDGIALASQGDVVVVTLNHRLNVFGFLHLADIAGAEFASSGNEGMMDIVVALKWVQRNIHRFGGNPQNITIFGESGGGRKVATLMGMPPARRLFHRAIIQSGPGIHLQPRDKATEVALALLAELGVPPGNVPQLQALPAEQILAAYRAVENRFDSLARQKGSFEQRGFVPTVGVKELPAYAFDPLASAYSKDVPLLIGSNRHELALFSRNDPKIYEQTLSEQELAGRVGIMVGNQRDRVLSVYSRLYPQASPAERWLLMVSDRTYRNDSITLAQRKAALGPAVYMYFFTLESKADPKLLAHHALEIPFAFNNLDATEWTTNSPVEQKLAMQMSSAWIAFARDGNPNTPALPEWPSYNPGTRSTMILDAECRVLNDPDAEIRKLWLTI